MGLTKLDYLSSPITLYYYGSTKHKSFTSSIISLLSIFLTVIIAIFFLSDFFRHKNPKAYFYNKFSADIGTFSFNSSSLFHFLTIGFNKFDSKSLRVISTYKFISDYLYDSDLSQNPHWIYNLCNITDADNQKEILEISEVFTNSVCIEQSWNVEKQRYFYKNEEGFQWPEISKGVSNDEWHHFGIFVLKCKNISDTVLHKEDCKSEKEIEEYMSKQEFANLRFADYYVDVGQYSNPNIKYYNQLSIGLFDNTFAVNNLNFNPVTVTTREGIFFDEKTIEKSFMSK